MSDIVKASTYEAKVTRNLNVTGLEGDTEDDKEDLKEELIDLVGNQE